MSGVLNIKVISRTSAFRYKKRDIEPTFVTADELAPENPEPTARPTRKKIRTRFYSR